MKKLTEFERNQREVKDIMRKIQKFEKAHPKRLIESACSRYKSARVDQRQAQKDIEIAEIRLTEARGRLR